VPFDIASGGTNTSGAAVGTSGNLANIWAPGNSSGNQSKTLDVGNYTGASDTSGVFGVDQIWTMLNDIDGSIGYQGITLTLAGYQANGTTPITETIDLTAGVDYRSVGQTSVPNNNIACDVANAGALTTVGTNCTGHTSSTAKTSGTDSTYNSTNVSEGVSITVYNNAYTTQDTLTPGPDNYWLDVQDIVLGSSFLNGWLNTVTVTSNDGTGTQEKAILSALTVDQDSAATPEPGTVVLLTAAGLGGLVLFRRKRINNA